jgi:hypothetical protein
LRTWFGNDDAPWPMAGANAGRSASGAPNAGVPVMVLARSFEPSRRAANVTPKCVETDLDAHPRLSPADRLEG